MVVHDEMIDTNIQHKYAKTKAVGRLSATSGLDRVRLCRRKNPISVPYVKPFHILHGFYFHLTASFCN